MMLFDLASETEIVLNSLGVDPRSYQAPSGLPARSPIDGSLLATVPETSRVLITAHDAFNYFGRAFGVEVMAVQGISTATEAGWADRAAMVDYVKRHGVKAIFVESSVNPATIEEIARETGVKVGGELFSDAMGESGKMERGADGEEYDVGTWRGMMKHNVNVFVEAVK